VTVNAHLKPDVSIGELQDRFATHYVDEPLVRFQEAIPWPNQIAGQDGAVLGGLTFDAQSRRVVLVSTLDNLRKGAATQALQNINLAMGFPEQTGLSS
jgi:N-acetyl-gamma-glutamyl-phosphate reductase